MSESLYRPMERDQNGLVPTFDPGMDHHQQAAETLSVYLIRIHDRPYGFRIVATVQESADAALRYVRDYYGAQSASFTQPNYARIEHHCPVEPGKSCTFAYEE